MIGSDYVAQVSLELWQSPASACWVLAWQGCDTVPGVFSMSLFFFCLCQSLALPWLMSVSRMPHNHVACWMPGSSVASGESTDLITQDCWPRWLFWQMILAPVSPSTDTAGMKLELRSVSTLHYQCNVLVRSHLVPVYPFFSSMSYKDNVIIISDRF